jgi:hypothetical protein
MSTKTRWLRWEPQPHILADLAGRAPTKTTETLFDVFVGAYSANIPKIEGGPDPAEQAEQAASDPEREEGVPWAQWKADMLNRLFQEQGTSGQPGRITAATVQHGERKVGTKRKKPQGGASRWRG